jgi:UDP-2,3-diacylglucosamine pyrophosphatase LpxH
MDNKSRTIIVSDLHLGGGPSDPGDDHVYQNRELVRFIEAHLSSPEGSEGRIELFFNGDFLEFAQTNPQAYRSPSTDFWCSSSESLEKLESIISGHMDIMQALKRFQDAGNQVTIAAGNHDVDLFWQGVQSRLRQCTGDTLRFEIGADWVERHNGRLHISHGHQWDPANRFAHWNDPRIDTAPGGPRLEMCPGTLFMVKFVNGLEDLYPFADNLHPVQNLAGLLMRQDKGGLAMVGWMFLKFAGCHPKTLGVQSADDLGDRLVRRIREDDEFTLKMAAACNHLETGWTADRVREKVQTEEQLVKLMMRLLGTVPLQEWQDLFAPGSVSTLGDGGGVTLGRILQAKNFGKEALRDRAQERVDNFPAAQVIVMGHTHIPDSVSLTQGKYHNPGSWTRYLDLESNPGVTLEDLKDEAKFPFALNYVQVDAPPGDGPLTSQLLTFEKSL